MAACDASTRTYRDGMQVETLAVTYAQTVDGVRVVMQTGDYVQTSEPSKDTLFRLIGTQGTLDFYGWEPRYRLLNADYPQGQLVEVTPGPRSAHQRHLENLAEQMDQGHTGLQHCRRLAVGPRNVRGGLPLGRSGGVPVPCRWRSTSSCRSR